MAHKNVSWVEPNFTYSETKRIKENGIDTNQNMVYETIPPMENYCIVVDLEVEVSHRRQIGFSEPKRTFVCSWTSKAGEPNSSVSFFSGSKHTFGESKEKNYLTSNPTTFGTFEEVKTIGTNECFGIRSIDIQYNNYSVPEVTIEFTDIRGISLFSQEELRHNEVDENGIGGMYDSKEDVAGSFFKCFFTFPYPKFTLMVKGFYGEPTAYELTVSDFRASFDCNSGNFNATAKFIGYAYSLLNDVTMNALVVAPLSEYIGKEYWKNRNFTFDDGTPMPTINDVVLRTEELLKHLEKHDSNSPEAIKQNDLSVEQQKIMHVYDSYNQFLNLLQQNLNEYKLKESGEGYVFSSIPDKKVVVFVKSDEKSKKISLRSEVIEAYKELESYVKSFGNNLEGSLKKMNIDSDNNLKLTQYNDKVTIDEISKLFKDYQTSLPSGYFTDNVDKIKVWIYNGTSLNETIENKKESNDNEIKENEKIIAQKKQEEIEKVLGFSNSVQNITKLILAHFETLVNSIYNCANSIKDRTAASLGMVSTDVVLQKDKVPAFPRVDVKNTYNGVTATEEGWIADLPGGANEPEVNLIEGLLKGVNVFQKTVDETSQTILTSGSSSSYVRTVMEIPLTPLDCLLTEHPFGDDINFSNLSDFVGKIGLRMLSLFGIVKGMNDYTNMGIADAINFKAKYPQPSKSFLDKLCASDGVINTNIVKNMLQNTYNVQELKYDKKWAWDGNNDKSTSLFNGSTLNKYKINDTVYVPISNIDWESINKDLDSNNNSNIHNYVTTNYVNHSGNEEKPYYSENIFRIDLNYSSYGGYKSKMCLNNVPLSYVGGLNLEFDAKKYLERYFYDDGRVFVRKFSENQKNIITYTYAKGTHTLPSSKSETLIESFADGSDYENNFNEIRDGESLIKINRPYGLFSNAENEIDCVTTFTIPSFKGITYDNEFTPDYSIFGQVKYYELESNYAKALVFLDSLKLKEEGINFGGVRFDNYALDNDKNITAHIQKDDEPFEIMPYCGLLLLGGYYWREQQETDPIKTFVKESNARRAIAYSIEDSVFELRQDIKNYLIDEFKNWVDNEFKYYQEQFEIKPSNGEATLSFVKQLIQQINSDKKNIVKYLYDNVDDTFFENYISFKESNGNLKLFNRETSVAVRKLANFYVQPCMVIKPTKYVSNAKVNYVKISDGYEKYISSFITKLRELYQNEYNTSKGEIVTVNPINTNEHIKISLYKYIKILYDKWLSGTEESEWSLSKFYENNWHFIDSYYNNVGDRTYINIKQFCNDIIYSQKENGYSLLSFLSKTYATSRFAFHCVQNFMNLNNPKEDAKFQRLFDAIPYNEIDFNNVNIHPSFIVMYTYEYSSKLDIKGAEYQDDSFDISSEDVKYLPTPISTKSLSNGYRVPAFGVTYGKQYQSYFKDINVSMDNPMVTEQSLKAQFMIASMNSEGGENGKKIDFLGQDLYTIYSNNSYTCTVKMMGCAWIQPLMYFQLFNVPMFRGAYLIQKVSHHIEPGNMETTFVGTRMAKTTTQMVEKPLVLNDNDQVPPYVSEIVEGAQAEVTNDCEYKFFNPLLDSDSPRMTKEELNMNFSTTYKDYVGTEPKITFNGTVKELIASVIESEASGEGTLGKQLVATVLFNRYMYHGKNLTKVIYGNQHAYHKSPTQESLDIAENIFINSPIILRSDITKVDKQVPILVQGKPNGLLSEPIALTDHMLKSMDGYCTIRGYDLNYEGTEPKEPFGWWHNAKYVCNHKGHVFVAGAYQKGETEYWQEFKENTTNDDSIPSKKAKGLFEAIKSTVSFSNNISVDDIKMENDKYGDKDVFYVTVKPEKAMIDTFDAIVNTYYDYFSECNWIVKNDANEHPNKIRVKAENNATKRIISIAKLNNNGTVDNLNQYEGLSKFFYTTLKKKYKSIDTNNKETFKVECPNFSTLISKDVDWMNTVNNLIGVTIKSCDGKVNLPTIDGYSFDGDTTPSNYGKPTTRFNSNFSPIGAADYAKNHKEAKSIGKCAGYVSKAMREGGNAGNMSDRPLSACAYSKFMEAWGWKEVYRGFSPSVEGYSPQKGDVSVIAGTSAKPHGHIQIYNDGLWYSDYGDKDAFCYNADKGRPYIIYRWETPNIT